MRCRIELKFIDDHPAPVPYDCQYALSSLIYSRITAANEALGLQLHYSTSYKHFCFSWLQYERVRPTKNGLIPLERGAALEFGGPDRELIRAVAEGFLDEPEFDLVATRGKHGRRFNRLCVQRFEVLAPPAFDGGPVKFSTLSPVVVRTMRDRDDRDEPQVWDLAPTEPQFHTNLYRNLLHRFEDYYGTRPEDDRFALTAVERTKPKRVRIKNTYHRCWHMSGVINGAPALVRFAYDSGLGEKGSMGFGCIEFIHQ